jgi:hypothetical protein
MKHFYNFLPICGNVLSDHASADAEYYIERLRKVLLPQAGFFCRHVPGGIQVWCSDNGSGENGDEIRCEDNSVLPVVRSFQRFTLRVQSGTEAGRYVLVVSCDGHGYILRECLRELLCRHPDTRIFRMAVYEGMISNWSQLPMDAQYNPEELFPLLNPAVARWLGIQFPKQRRSINICTLNQRINGFLEKYCRSSAFLSAIPHTGCLQPADPSLCGYFPAPQLQFGKGGLHTTPAEGLQLYGPAQRPPGSHFQCFFIYFEPDAPHTDVFLSRMPGNCGICCLVRLPMTCNPSLNIVLEPGQDAPAQAKRQMEVLSLDPEVRYVAFYLNPGSSDGKNNSSHNLYFLLREMLDKLEVILVGVEHDIMISESGSALAALAGRIVSRLGGQAWMVAGAGESDLVAGVAGCAVPGIAVAAACFTGNGLFLGADFTKRGDRSSVAGLILEMFERHPGFRRIVIHYFDHGHPGSPEIPEWLPEELYPGIPVVGVGISRHREGGILLFNDTSVPSPGTWARTGKADWLLVTAPCGSGSFLPLNLHFSCSCPGYLDQEGVVTGLLEQVHAFCYLKRGKGSSLPVTLRMINGKIGKWIEKW